MALTLQNGAKNDAKIFRVVRMISVVIFKKEDHTLTVNFVLSFVCHLHTPVSPTPPHMLPTTASSPKQQTPVYDALIAPERIQALSNCDRYLLTYQQDSFLLVFRTRGRNVKMIVLPLAALILWDLFWGLFLITYHDPLRIRDQLQSLEATITPILTPVSFLLVFRLGRAGVRYWDARAALGKTVEVCRTMASTALAGLRPSSFSSSKTGDDSKEQQRRRQLLADDFVRWIAVMPVATKNFLRPWEGELTSCHRANEIGEVLIDGDKREFLASKGTTIYAPVLVLNRLRQLAREAAQETCEQNVALSAVLLRQLNEQIDTLTGAWGAMERINGTPLPFVYVVHLRTFLLLYLLLWHMEAIASGGWPSLLPLQLASWGLLGIEAAAVECERPFQWHSNHLALGKAGIVVAQNLAQTYYNLGWEVRKDVIVDEQVA